MTISWKPAPASRRRCRSMRVSGPRERSGLGCSAVHGPIRSPRPADSSIAFIGAPAGARRPQCPHLPIPVQFVEAAKQVCHCSRLCSATPVRTSNFTFVAALLTGAPLTPVVAQQLCLLQELNLPAEDPVAGDGAVAAAGATAAGEERLTISAGQVNMVGEERVEFDGDVSFRYGDRSISADRASFDRTTGTAEIHGAVAYRDGQVTVYGEDAEVDTRNREITFTGGGFDLPLRPARGAADAIRIRGDNTISLESGELHHLPVGPARLGTDRQGTGDGCGQRLRSRAQLPPAFQGPADPGIALRDVPAGRPPQERPADAQLLQPRTHRIRHLRSRLPQPGAQLRHDGYRPLHARARRPGTIRVPLPVARRRRTAPRRIPSGGSPARIGQELFQL